MPKIDLARIRPRTGDVYFSPGEGPTGAEAPIQPVSVGTGTPADPGYSWESARVIVAGPTGPTGPTGPVSTEPSTTPGPTGATGAQGADSSVPGPPGDFRDIVYGPTAPADTDSVWVDYSDESTSWEDEALLDEITDQVDDLADQVDELALVLATGVDPGYFQNMSPGTDEELLGTVPHVWVKRGYKNMLADPDGVSALLDGEMGFCIDTQELYIANKGALRLLARAGGGSGGSEGGTLTGEYVELVTTNGTKYRLTMNDEGRTVIINALCDTATPPVVSDAGRYAGLIINKVYGGGIPNSNNTPVSHSFIELYNMSSANINLKGLAIQYGDMQTPWKIYPLRGEVKPGSSFVIRGAMHTDPYRSNIIRVAVMDFDQSIPDLAISDIGFKVYLNIPEDMTVPTQYINPANINNDNNLTREPGYLSLFSAGGEQPSQVIDAYEAKSTSGSMYRHIVNKYRVIYRDRNQDSKTVSYPFANSGSTYDDIIHVDIRMSDVTIYGPRSGIFGQWNNFYNQLTLDPGRPNNINFGFGKDGDRDRLFTWHGPSWIEWNYLLYRNVNDPPDAWIRIQATYETKGLPDADVNVNSVAVRGLVPGTYVYKVGSEGRWSDLYEFVVQTVVPSDTIKMLMVTDQQGWDKYEYTAWGKSNTYIEANETYDFIINTGDISQNANRPFEWRSYYHYATQNLGSHCHMTCVGNNDLIANEAGVKGDPAAFANYSTVDKFYKLPATTTLNNTDLTNIANAIKIIRVGDIVSGPGIPAGTIVADVAATTAVMSNPATASANTIITFTPPISPASVYSWNYGYLHFIGLNSNHISPFSTAAEEIDFIRRDMAIAENQKRWVIAYMHEAPYTIVSSATLRPYINVFDEVGVDLVLCGHHHCYSRSNKMAGIPTLLHFDAAAMVDTAFKTWTANGGCAVSTTQKKFGASSLLLDGVDDSLSTPPSADFAFLNYDFTIDFWVFCGAQTNANATILGNGLTTMGATACAIKVNATGHVVFGTLTSTTVITDSAWHHVALTRQAGTVRLFVDGAQQATGSNPSGIDFSLSGTLIGQNGWDGGTGFFSGYVDEFHVIKKLAKWTADFTPPSAAYGAADVDTVLPDSDPSARGFYCFMSQATGYKMSGKTSPATVAPYRAEYDKGVVDPCYAMFEITHDQIAIKPIRLTQIMPLENNVGRPAIGNSYHPFTITKT